MLSPQRTGHVLSERIVLATCFVHTVPRVAATIETFNGERFLVAEDRRDAILTPCQLRSALLHPITPGVPHLSSVIRSLEISSGVVDVGGGLYQRSHPSAADERWFVTTLPLERVLALAEQVPAHLDHADVSVRVLADTELGACAVCLGAEPSVGLRLDELACWLNASCLVDELCHPVTTQVLGRGAVTDHAPTDRRPDNP